MNSTEQAGPCGSAFSEGLGADDTAFEHWWAKQFWVDAYTAGDKETALAAWRASSLEHAPNDEKLRLLRRLCADAESNGWQHMATATVRAVLGALAGRNA